MLENLIIFRVQSTLRTFTKFNDFLLCSGPTHIKQCIRMFLVVLSSRKHRQTDKTSKKITPLVALKQLNRRLMVKKNYKFKIVKNSEIINTQIIRTYSTELHKHIACESGTQTDNVIYLWKLALADTNFKAIKQKNVTVESCAQELQCVVKYSNTMSDLWKWFILWKAKSKHFLKLGNYFCSYGNTYTKSVLP